MSMSEAFSIFYTLIKLHYTKALSDQALSLAPDWILLLQRPRIPVSRGSATIFQSNTYPYMTTGKIIALTRQAFVGKVMSLIFNMLSRLVIAFLPRSKCLLISWLQSSPAVILELKKIKSVIVSIVYLSICHEVMRLDAMILVLWMLSFKPAFSLSSFTFIKRLFSSSLFFATRLVQSLFVSSWIG